jgi:hypothetical protein
MASATCQDVTIEIGGTPIVLRTDDAKFRELLERRYPGFLRPVEADTLTFDIELREDGPISDKEDLYVGRYGQGWELVRGDFRAVWNPEKGQGRLEQMLSPYAVDAVLRIVHTLILAPQGGFLLHGASAIRNGRAFVFSGVSGAGKTTISGLAPADATLLTDEISYIRPHGSAYAACGTPFAGELARVGANVSAPIAHLYFLAKGPENRIDPIPQGEALRMLMRNILFFAEDSRLVEMVFRSAFEFLSRVPTSRLTFYPDERVWELIR